MDDLSDSRPFRSSDSWTGTGGTSVEGFSSIIAGVGGGTGPGVEGLFTKVVLAK